MVDDVLKEADRQATQFVIERNQLQAHVFAIAAAWEIWAEAVHEVRRHARSNEWSGELASGAQRIALQQQFNAQIFEGYARARVQCAVQHAADGVDTVEGFDEHFTEMWGAETLSKARAAYSGRVAEVIDRQHASRAAATAQREALEAAGVTSDLGPLPAPSGG